MILRYYVPPQGREEHLNELIETCRKTAVKEVLLFTSPAYGPGAGFPDRAELNERLEHLSTCAERIRGAGLVFSLNVFATLGHIFVAEEQVQHFGFWRQVGPDGSPALHPVLDPACPALHEYLAEAYQAYARLEPRLMFVDDDFGVGLHTAFHPERLRRFAGRMSCEADRAKISELIYATDRAIARDSRRVMRELVTSDLVELAAILRSAVHGQHAGIRLGLMVPSSAFFDVAAVAEALAQPHQPLVRPQLPLYREERPVSGYGDALWQLNYWRAKLPRHFEIFPEAENYPYTDFQKSPAAAWAHTAYCFGCGETNAALSLNSFSKGIPAGESRRAVEQIGIHHGQLAGVASLLAGGYAELGAGAWEAGEPRMLGVVPATPLDVPRLLGLPIYSAREPQDAILHWGLDLYGLSGETIGRVLAKGAVLDLDSAAYLQETGLLERTGMCLGLPGAPAEVLNLRFNRQDGSPEDWPVYYYIRNLGSVEMPRNVEVPAGGARSLIEFRNDRDGASLPFVLTWSGPQGGRFAFINASFRLWPRYALLNPWMGDVLAEVCRWVSGQPLPARVVNGPNVSIQVLRLAVHDQVLLTLINYSTASHPEIKLALDADLASHAYVELMPDGTSNALAIERSEKKGSLCLSGPTECLGVRFLLGTRAHP